MDSSTYSSNSTSETPTVHTLNDTLVMNLLPTVIYIAVLMIVGLVGNSIVFVVYYRRFKPSATRSFVLAMSVFDLATNTLGLPAEIYDIRFSYTLDHPALCRAMRFCNSFLALVTAFILVAVALDRFRKICRPLNKQHSLRRTTVSIVMCAGVSVVLTIPFTVLNGRHTVDTGVGNITGVTCSIDDKFVNTLFPMIYSTVMTAAFITSVTIMLVSYSRIARELWRHKRRSTVAGGGLTSTGGEGRGGAGWRDGCLEEKTSDAREESASTELQPSSSSREAAPLPAHAAQGSSVDKTEHIAKYPAGDSPLPLKSKSVQVQSMRGRASNVRRGRPNNVRRGRRDTVRKIPRSTTLMMFVLTAIFIVNYLPHLIIIILRAVLDDVDKGLTGWALNAYNIGLRSYFINCAVNSFVYGFCNARFRQECQQFFCNCVK